MVIRPWLVAASLVLSILFLGCPSNEFSTPGEVGDPCRGREDCAVGLTCDGSGSCSAGDPADLGDVGDHCTGVGRCLPGLLCSPAGFCYDPTADSHLPGNGDGDHCTREDADGDGIADIYEGNGDPDEDGRPNVNDLDADGDGIPDSVEAGNDADSCRAPADHDGDGIYDFLDLDSDADGLTDNEEALQGSNPYQADSDRDGYDDFVERAAGTRHDDPAEHPDDDVLIFVLPYLDTAGHQFAELEFQTTIRVADVLFLMDTTGSMAEEILNLQTGLRGIASSLSTLFDDVAMGVGRFEDFPLIPYGDVLAGDRVFELVQQITTEEDRVQMGVDSLGIRAGRDLPESQVPALWHIATGDPLGYYLPRAVLDPTVPGTGVIGGVGFREDSQPIIVLVTDAPMHNNSVGSDPYAEERLGIAAPTYSATVASLNDVGARIVGIGGSEGTADLTALARDTGSVLAEGTPLVYPIEPDGTAPSGDLSSQVTEGIEDLVLGTPQDVTTMQEDDSTDLVDARNFLFAVRPISGVPEAPRGYEGHDGASEPYGTFFGVIPGTTTIFEVEAYNETVEQLENTQVFRLSLIVVGNGVARLDERLVVIVIPAAKIDVPFI